MKSVQHSLYEFFYSSLKQEFTQPIDAPNLARFRLVDMFTSATHQSVKDSIIDAFCKQDSPLRIVICMVAFGMGVDCVGVQQIVHWGAAQDVESYVQESGRAGRDGTIWCAAMYYKKSDLDARRVTKDMINYCKNTDQCRRSVLFAHFDNTSKFSNNGQQKPTGCLCCDVCAVACQCNKCMCNSFPL